MAAVAGRVASAPTLPVGPLRTAGDERLVALVRAGSEPAFEAIYDRHHRALLSFCRHLVGSRHEAEDALQQTFLAAYRGLVDSDKPIALRPWLYAIARNQSINALRARREHALAEPDELPSVTEGLSDQVLHREDLREMVGDLRRLPDDQRAALVLSELGDLSHEEIAGVIGCRTDKVKALVFQAREKLAGSRDARAIPCRDIRTELATARAGVLRRGPLRTHIAGCDGCRGFRDEVVRQRRAMAVLLPVIPSAGLKAGALPWAAGGGAAAAGGAAAVGGGAAAGGAAVGGGGTVGVVSAGGGFAAFASTTAAKALVIGAIAVAGTAGGVEAVRAVRATETPQRAEGPTSSTPAASASPIAASPTPPQSSSSQGVTPARRAGKGGNAQLARERRAARRRARAKARRKAAGRPATPPGLQGRTPSDKGNGAPKADPGARGNGNANGNGNAGGQGTGRGGGSSNAGGNGGGRDAAPAAPRPVPQPAAGNGGSNAGGNGKGASDGSNGKGAGKPAAGD